jgi:DNA mismatch repair ATPase MutS
VEKEEQIMQREVMEIFSKGVFTNYSTVTYEEKYLISVVSEVANEVIAIAAVELHQRKIFVGTITKTGSQTASKTMEEELSLLLHQTKPSEILINTNSKELLTRITKQISLKSKLTDKGNTFDPFWHFSTPLLFLEKEFGPFEKGDWPLVLKLLYQEKENRALVFSALGGLFNHLKDHKLLDKYLKLAKFFNINELIYPLVGRRLFMDNHTLMNLDVLSSKEKSGLEGELSLLELIDRTSSNLGKRLMKKWVQNPLCDIDIIQTRLNAVEDLERRKADRENFKIRLKTLGDIEHLTNKLYSYSISRDGDTVNINYYLEDRSVARYLYIKAKFTEIKR